MLSPSRPHSLYTELWEPPEGLCFDEAVSATFSLDPAVLLQIPVHVLLGSYGDFGRKDPISLHRGLSLYSDRISVYVQKGRIRDPGGTPSKLFALLAKMIVEVAPDKGSFHPKVWAVRFADRGKGDIGYRLAIMSKNLTADNSWDLCLALDGKRGDRNLKANGPLAGFFRSLPDLACLPADSGKRGQAGRFADELHTVSWELPDGFRELRFYPLPARRRELKNVLADRDLRRLAVISPFLGDEALAWLAGGGKRAELLVSRPDALQDLREETLGLFERTMVLDEEAEGGVEEEQPQEGEGEPPANIGLHAKAYILETRRPRPQTRLIVGSANATGAGLGLGRVANHEFLVELVGDRSDAVGIDALSGRGGLENFLANFKYDKGYAQDTRKENDDVFNNAQRIISNTHLSLRCSKTTSSDDFTLVLIGKIPRLDGIEAVLARPITVSRGNAAILGHKASSHCLGKFSKDSLTSLVAFTLKIKDGDEETGFCLNLETSGLPPDRDAAIMRSVVASGEDFLRYLDLILSKEGLSWGDDLALPRGLGEGTGGWGGRPGGKGDTPLLERLVRNFCRNPEQLREVTALVDNLSRDGASGIIPSSLISLCETFKSAIGDKDVQGR
ncbi:MAG: phospholipase D family protein [Deltaproteobacteria bacterium]|jgi:hypothetical protein|nr:phospholipase D family protein [Deltaproteobacteria bacterium]